VQPHNPKPGVRQPPDSGPGQDIHRALASIEGKFPSAVIWFGTATGQWWAMAGTGRRAQLLEAESPSALTATLARLDVAGPPGRDPRVPTPTRPQAALRAGPHKEYGRHQADSWTGREARRAQG
jgi:hypothetical protein